MLDIILYTILIIIIIICIYILINFIYDYLSYKVSNDNKIENTASIINTDLNITHDNINNLHRNMNNNLTNITRDYSNVIAVNDTNLNNKININNNFTSNINSNIVNFDYALKKYFTFDELNEAGTVNSINTALFNYTFNNITPKKLNILSKINAVSGITIKTTQSNTSPDNLRICDNQATIPNCLNFNLNNGFFNITPETPNSANIKINNYDGTSLASFDMNNKTIKLGIGSINDDSSLFIKDDKVYLKNLALINPINPLNQNTLNNDKSFIDYNSINNINTELTNIKNQVICYYNISLNQNNNVILTANIIANTDLNASNYINITFPEITANPGTSIVLDNTTNSYQYINNAMFLTNVGNAIKFNISQPIIKNTNITIRINSGILGPSNLSSTNPINNIAYGNIMTI